MSFRFKKFTIEDDQSTMKVGTDAVLLGAMADARNASIILEIGTGCGIVALMLAQRSTALIHAIDMDKASIVEANGNFQHSPWPGRLHAINEPLRNWAEMNPGKYDLIVGNPPFFNDSLRSPNARRNLSRHTGELNFLDLMHYSNLLLKEGGKATFIYPCSAYDMLDAIACEYRLYPSEKTFLIPRHGKDPNRVLATYSHAEGFETQISFLVIRDVTGKYTPAYQTITSDFHVDLKD